MASEPVRSWPDDPDAPPGDRPDGADDLDRRPTLFRALRTALGGYFEDFAVLAVVNLVLVLALLAVAAAFSAFRPSVVALPLAALPAAVLARGGVELARGGRVSWTVARHELGRRAWRKVALAAAQLAITGVAVLNLSIAAAIGGMTGVVVAAVGAYGIIVTWAYALALWPIVADPVRDGPLRDQLRLALVVLVTRPVRVAALLAVVGVAGTACALLVVPMIVLPAVVVLWVAAYVTASADSVAAPRVA